MAPTFRAIDLSRVKLHARADAEDTEEDSLLLDYVEAATEYVGRMQNRSLRSSTWQAIYDAWPECGEFYLPFPPLVSVSSITYLLDGVATTVSSSVYSVDAISEPGRVFLAEDQVWPSHDQVKGGIVVTFVAGYANAAAIPATTKQAIRTLVSHWYEIREPVIVGGSVSTVPMSVDDLAAQEKFVGYR